MVKHECQHEIQKLLFMDQSEWPFQFHYQMNEPTYPVLATLEPWISLVRWSSSQIWASLVTVVLRCMEAQIIRMYVCWLRFRTWLTTIFIRNRIVEIESESHFSFAGRMYLRTLNSLDLLPIENLICSKADSKSRLVTMGVSSWFEGRAAQTSVTSVEWNTVKNVHYWYLHR